MLIPARPRPRGRSSMAEHQLPKLTVRVRFPSPALDAKNVAVHVNWEPSPGLDRRQSASTISTRAIRRAISHAGWTVSSSEYESHSLAPGLQGPRDLGEERVDGSEVPGGLVAAEAVAGTGHHEVRTRSYAPPRLRIPQTAKGTATIRPDRGDTGTRLKDQHQPDRPIKTLGEPPPGAPAGPTSYCPIH